MSEEGESGEIEAVLTSGCWINSLTNEELRMWNQILRDSDEEGSEFRVMSSELLGIRQASR